MELISRHSIAQFNGIWTIELYVHEIEMPYKAGSGFIGKLWKPRLICLVRAGSEDYAGHVW